MKQNLISPPAVRTAKPVFATRWRGSSLQQNGNNRRMTAEPSRHNQTMKRNRKPANEPDDAEKNLMWGYLPQDKTTIKDILGEIPDETIKINPGNPALSCFVQAAQEAIRKNFPGFVNGTLKRLELEQENASEIYEYIRNYCYSLKRKEQLSPSRLAKLKATGKKGAVAAELTKDGQEKKDRVAIMADFNKRLSANRRQYQRTEDGYLKLEAICEEVANRHLGANGKPIMSASAIKREHYRRTKRNRNKAAT